jgi:hypothetical protein
MSGRIMDAIHGAADRPQMVEPSRGPEAGPANELPGRMM